MALVTTGEFDGAIVDTRTVGRPVGDTNSGAVFVTDLPKNFHGGDEALHFALGELFGQYGKIKKIELYMEEGILDTQDFKGEALVVYHKTKMTGKHDKGDPVFDACTEMDGKWRLLGQRGRRMRCEAAVWQKEGFDVKKKVKVHPCVEIANLWEYDPSTPMSWFMEVQDAIRQHAVDQGLENPFVKVEPSEGTACIWTKGAQEAMKFASIMHKSFFLGRKITTSLCRKEKPVNAEPTKLKLPTAVWDGSGAVPGTQAAAAAAVMPVITGIFTEAPEEEKPAASAAAEEASAKEAPAAKEAALAPPPPPKELTRNCKVRVQGLMSKPENNGKIAVVVDYIEDTDRYQVSLDGRLVKLKRENLEFVEEAVPPNRPKKKAKVESKVEDDDEDPETAEAEAAKVFEAAQKMAAGEVRHGPESLHDPLKDGFLATVCVDPALLPKKAEPEEDPEEVEARARRERSRSRQRRQDERLAAAKARLEAEAGPRPSWVLPTPAELQAKAAADTAKAGGAAGAATGASEPEQSREELMKLSVGKLKELLVQFGKTARGCLEKRDFVDRLKPPPKA